MSEKVKRYIPVGFGHSMRELSADDSCWDIGYVKCEDYATLQEQLTAANGRAEKAEQQNTKRGEPLIEADHPEAFCDECGGVNPSWHAPNELWNAVTGNVPLVLCPVCFQRRAEKLGYSLHMTTDTTVNDLDRFEWSERCKSIEADCDRWKKKAEEAEGRNLVEMLACKGVQSERDGWKQKVELREKINDKRRNAAEDMSKLIDENERLRSSLEKAEKWEKARAEFDEREASRSKGEGL